LRKADVDQRYVMMRGDLRDDLRFADTGRTPQHHGRVSAIRDGSEFPLENNLDLRGAHEGWRADAGARE
jgi:hypothetical protein